MVEALEQNLSKYLFRRRLIYCVSLLFFLFLGILFTWLREESKEIVIYGEGIFSYESVSYNETYVIGIVFGFLTAMAVGCFLFSDLLLCRYQTAEVNNHYVTVYRGMVNCIVYVDGEEKERITFTNFNHVIGTKLPDGVKMSVAFNKGAFSLAHISFSDNNSPIDL